MTGHSPKTPDHRAAARREASAAQEPPASDDRLGEAARAALSGLAAGSSPGTPVAAVGVAVSGGSDSMATLVLLARLHPVAAVTVDHGLRPEAAAEAAFVARFCAERGIPHSTLRWSGPAPTGNLMDQARRARLRLIGEWARAQGIPAVALGHTADDEAETFLLRLGREAGLEGLAGMRREFEAGGVRWVRPFLRHSREELRDFLRRQGIGWIEDPTNADDRYDRVKARRALRTLGRLGIGAGRIVATVDHLAAAEAALRQALDRLIRAHVREVSGDLLIDAPAFRQEFDPEMQRRLVVAGLRWTSGADYAPRGAKVADFLAHWQTRPGSTLLGCRLTLGPDVIRISREARAVAGLQTPSQTGRWDRWRLEGPAAPGLRLAALGAEGLRQAGNWRDSGLPRASLLASPAVWDGESLLAAPVAGLENGWKAQIACGAFASWAFRR